MFTVAGVKCLCVGRKMSPRNSFFVQLSMLFHLSRDISMYFGTIENGNQLKPMFGVLEVLYIKLLSMNRLNQTETADFTICKSLLIATSKNIYILRNYII